MLIYKHFAVFLKTIHTEEEHHRNLYNEENVDVSQKYGAQISYSNLFSIRIGAYRHVLQIGINIKLHECFKNTFKSTDSTSRGRPKYKNCRIVKSALDVIDCD